MIRVAITDTSAECRTQLEREVRRLLEDDSHERSRIPLISLIPLAPEEVQFHSAPDVCIIGRGIVTQEMHAIRLLRESMPLTTFLVAVPPQLDTIETIEQLARYGGDDTFSSLTQPFEFMKKLILLGRRTRVLSQGKLLLIDGGKGGVGVTTIAAALGHSLRSADKSVLLIDLDGETQDLARFLEAPPFMNESLCQLLSEQRAISQDFVRQCINTIEVHGKSMDVMPPSLESDSLFDGKRGTLNIFTSILELVESSYDAIVIDAGGARGALLRTLYRIADSVIYVSDLDAASVYAGVDRLSKLHPAMASDASLTLVMNQAGGRRGLAADLVVEEFVESVGRSDRIHVSDLIPFSHRGNRWPASGETLYSLGSSCLRGVFDCIRDQTMGIVRERGDAVSWSLPRHPMIVDIRRILRRVIDEVASLVVRRGASLPPTRKSPQEISHVQEALPSAGDMVPEFDRDPLSHLQSSNSLAGKSPGEVEQGGELRVC